MKFLKMTKHRSKENEMRAKLKAALRKIWVGTSRRDFLLNVRQDNHGPENFRYRVNCVECRRSDGITEKYHVKSLAGKISKKPKLWYQVDHLENLPPLEKIPEDLLPFYNALFNGRLQVLCFECHRDKTLTERKKKC